MAEINTLADLVRAVSNSKTGGYEVDFDIKPNLERARSGDGFFLVIEVNSTEPFPPFEGINGEYWFWDDNTVMQVQ